MLCVARDEGRTEPRHVSEDVLENEVTGPTGCSSEVPAQTPGFSQVSPKCLPSVSLSTVLREMHSIKFHQPARGGFAVRHVLGLRLPF